MLPALSLSYIVRLHCKHMCKLLPFSQPDKVCMADCVSSCYEWLEVRVLLRDVPQCNCSPLRLYELGSSLWALLSGFGLRGRPWPTHQVLQQPYWRSISEHLVLTKNDLTAHVKHKQHHLCWLHSCSPSSRISPGRPHILWGHEVSVLDSLTSRRITTSGNRKVTACHACVSALQQQHECETSYISGLSQDGVKKELKQRIRLNMQTSKHI